MENIRRFLGHWLKRYHTKLGSYFYIVMAILSVGGMTFLLMSRSIFVDDSPLLDSGIGQTSEQEIGNAHVQIVQRNINSKAGYGEILIEVNTTTSNTVGQKYCAIIGQVSKNGKHEAVLPSTLKKINERYYVLQFSKFKTNWKHLIIDFGQLNKSQLIAGKDYAEFLKGDGQSSTNMSEQNKKPEQKSFSIDYRKVSQSAVTHPQKKGQYLAQALSLDLKTNQQKIKSVKHDIQQGKTQVTAMHTKVEAIKADEAYQTDVDIKVSQAQIETIQSDIKATKVTIKKAKIALSDLYSQQNNLRSKLRRLP